jgi:putative serine protease PepD
VSLSSLRLSLPLVALLLLAPSTTLRAQEDDDEKPKTPKKVEREAAPAVVGRNQAMREAFKDVAAKTRGVVVKVGADAYGVIIEGKFIVTTANAAAKAGRVKVTGPAGSAEARVVGVDEKHAVGLLESPFDAKGVALAPTDLTIGQIVVTVGIDETPVAVGVLSAKNRRVEPRDLSQSNMLMGLMSDGIDGPKRSYPKVLQHDAPMTDETLGTLLVDSDGKLLGMNVGTGYRGSSYAIAAADLLASVKAIQAGKVEEVPETREKPAKAAGKPLLAASIKESDGALLVEEVVDGGPAAKAGLSANDRILSVDGEKVKTLNELGEKIGAHKPGDTLTFRIARDGKKLELSVTLGAR